MMDMRTNHRHQSALLDDDGVQKACPLYRLCGIRELDRGKAHSLQLVRSGASRSSSVYEPPNVSNRVSGVEASHHASPIRQSQLQHRHSMPTTPVFTNQQKFRKQG
jgi:hypothetical protein